MPDSKVDDEKSMLLPPAKIVLQTLGGSVKTPDAPAGLLSWHEREEVDPDVQKPLSPTSSTSPIIYSIQPSCQPLQRSQRTRTKKQHAGATLQKPWGNQLELSMASAMSSLTPRTVLLLRLLALLASSSERM
jgi:hypothetical protein